MFQAGVQCRGRATYWWVRWHCCCCASVWAYARHDTNQAPRTHCVSDTWESRLTLTRRSSEKLRQRSCPSSRFVDRDSFGASYGCRYPFFVYAFAGEMMMIHSYSPIGNLFLYIYCYVKITLTRWSLIMYRMNLLSWMIITVVKLNGKIK